MGTLPVHSQQTPPLDRQFGWMSSSETLLALPLEQQRLRRRQPNDLLMRECLYAKIIHVDVLDLLTEEA
jgi:hypothetical protein